MDAPIVQPFQMMRENTYQILYCLLVAISFTKYLLAEGLPWHACGYILLYLSWVKLMVGNSHEK